MGIFGKSRKEPKIGVDKLSLCVSYDEIFRVKGREGLYVVDSKPAGGTIRMKRFNQSYQITAKVPALASLENLVIYKGDGSFISLGDAFDNLQDYSGGKEIKTKDDICETICPDYDPEKFKVYHGRKIIQWYNEIIQAVKMVSDEYDKPQA